MIYELSFFVELLNVGVECTCDHMLIDKIPVWSPSFSQPLSCHRHQDTPHIEITKKSTHSVSIAHKNIDPEGWKIFDFVH